jgi:hypothetical protein
MLASQMDTWDVIRLLLQNGAAVESREDDGWTPGPLTHQELLAAYCDQGRGSDGWLYFQLFWLPRWV